MKQIIAIVKPFLAEKVIKAVESAGVDEFTIREVKGFGRQKSYLSEYQENEYAMAYLPKVEIDIWVDDDQVDTVVRMIVEVSRTGRMGDGKIFVLPTDRTISLN